MAGEIDDLDDVRYEHHLKHRGRSNKALLQLFWISVCGIIALRLAQRLWIWRKQRRFRKRNAHAHNVCLPVAFARIIAAMRAISMLSLPLPVGLQTISLGRIAFLAIYTCIIAILLVSVDAPKFSEHFLDDVAFRAAWVTVTQVPLVYFLATKSGPLNILAGVSYERINWIHRWVGRMLFVSATAHMSIMMSSISITELMRSPDKAMSVVRYGAGAYGTLTWIAVSSVLPLRKWSYRLFFINHWCSTLGFLWIVSYHVPKYARLPIYASFTLVAVDKCLHAYRLLWNNVTIRPLKRRFAKFRKGPSRQVLAMGHPVKMMTPYITNGSAASAELTTVIRICDVPFSWKPGQHIRIYLPRLGPLEVHPFTPATCSDVSSSPLPPHKNNDAEHNGLLPHNPTSAANEMVLMIRARSGLTKRLLEYHSKWLALPCPNASRPSTSLTAYLDGPFGNPPAWESYENLILISTSTGVSFILSILDYLEQLCFEGQARLCAKRIQFVWVNRHREPQFEATVTDLLSRYSTMLRESDINVEAEFYVTCSDSKAHEVGIEMQEYDPFSHLRRPRQNYFTSRPPLRIRNPNALEDEDESDDDDNEDDDNEDDRYQDQDQDEEENPKNIEPSVDELGSRSSCETYVSSTLIDEEDSVMSDLESTLDELESSCWSRMPSLRLPGNTSHVHEEADYCQCALVRHQERKCRLRTSPGFIERIYGTRPDFEPILSSIPRTSTAKTMVAICANPAVASQAKAIISKMNIDFAKGRRGCEVDVYTEGFS